MNTNDAMREKRQIHHQLSLTVLINKAILGYISTLTFFLLKNQHT